MIRLGVNIDHIATLRQARRAREPEPITAAQLAILGGADGITIHLREDRRHIQDRDLQLLRPVLPQRLNLEMACVDAIADLALLTKPDEATLVPERREELTTECGLDVLSQERSVGRMVERLKQGGMVVSLFIDPDEKQVEAARRLGADAIEFQTASYSEALGQKAIARELAILLRATEQARAAHLHVHMGHGLNYTNVQAVAAIPGVEELNIGHSIIARSVFVGIEKAVRQMKEAIREGELKR